MCEVTGFFAYNKRTAFSDLRSLLFFCVKTQFFRVSATPDHDLYLNRYYVAHKQVKRPATLRWKMQGNLAISQTNN